MAPLPYNNTNIYKVAYGFGGTAHDIIFRGQPGTSELDLRLVAQDYFDALAGSFDNTFAISGATYQLAGSGISLPAAAPTGLVVSGSTLSGINKPRFVNFSGRGVTTGRRHRMYQYGLVFSGQDDYRLQPGEFAAGDAALAVLTSAAAGGVLATIATDAPQFYGYINCGFNAYHQRQQR